MYTYCLSIILFENFGGTTWNQQNMHGRILQMDNSITSEGSSIKDINFTSARGKKQTLDDQIAIDMKK